MNAAAVVALLVKIIRATEEYEWGTTAMLLHLDTYSPAERDLVEAAAAILREELNG